MQHRPGEIYARQVRLQEGRSVQPERLVVGIGEDRQEAAVSHSSALRPRSDGRHRHEQRLQRGQPLGRGWLMQRRARRQLNLGRNQLQGEVPARGLEVLRQPLEDRTVTISRAQGSLTFPANFMLVGAQNPCPCGYWGDPEHTCRSCREATAVLENVPPDWRSEAVDDTVQGFLPPKGTRTYPLHQMARALAGITADTRHYKGAIHALFEPGVIRTANTRLSEWRQRRYAHAFLADSDRL